MHARRAADAFQTQHMLRVTERGARTARGRS